MLEVTPIPALRDNYIWLVHGRRDPRQVMIVDPGESAPVEAALEARGLQPKAILVTHHHPDHTGGAGSLSARFSVPVYGPAREAGEVVDRPLGEGDVLEIDPLQLTLATMEIPGHTLGHIAVHGHDAVFCGDTLFSAGCGRLFEGTPEQMADSLARLAALPGSTRVYCGHEYTAANLAFAGTVEPDNAAIAAYSKDVAALRERGEPSLPSRIDMELAVNPFLRTGEAGVRRAAEQWSGDTLDDKVRVFAALRRWKDEFR